LLVQAEEDAHRPGLPVVVRVVVLGGKLFMPGGI
jgi:hypothetical protein